ncbi:MAG: hypothetical protein KKA19_08560 [Candidatus Margulisbacteria bacterium]|nr:hypothetical protein [Candidatus Margulisiibacteriota bacterium]
MSYRKIISTYIKPVFQKNLISFKCFRILIKKLFTGQKVILTPCKIITSPYGKIDFSLYKHKTILCTGIPKKQITLITPLYLKEYGWVLLITDKNNNLLNTYQVDIKHKSLKILYRSSIKEKKLNWLNAFLSGLPFEPQNFYFKTNNCGTIYISAVNKMITTGIKKELNIYFKFIKTEYFGWILLLIDPEKDLLLRPYQLDPIKHHIRCLWKGDREFNWLVAFLYGLTNELKPFSAETDINGNFNIKCFKSLIRLATGINKKKLIHFIPLRTIEHGWILLLTNKNNDLLAAYSFDLKKHKLNRLWFNMKHSYLLNWIIAYLFGLPVEPKGCLYSTNQSGAFCFCINKKKITVFTGYYGIKKIKIIVQNTKEYGWLLRIYNLEDTHLRDIQLLPNSLKKIQLFYYPYELQTIVDYLRGKNIQPLSSSRITDSQGIIHLSINTQVKTFFVGPKKAQVHLIPKYSENYGWLIEIWNEDKTELLTTIDRRRL